MMSMGSPEDALRAQIKQIRKDVDELQLIVNGNPFVDLPGIRKRLSIAEEEIEYLAEERKRQTGWLRTIGVCISILAFAQFAFLVWVGLT